MREREREQHAADEQVEQREDPQDAARVEVAEVVGVVAGVDQDAGDQEPADHEEQIDAGPARLDRPRPGRGPRIHPVDHDQHDRDAAQSIELGDITSARRAAIRH